MPNSTCPKCNNTHFEIKEIVPRTTRFKLLSVQCSSCGSVAGVMDYFNIGAQTEKIENKIDQTRNDLAALSSRIDQTRSALANLSSRLEDAIALMNRMATKLNTLK